MEPPPGGPAPAPVRFRGDGGRPASPDSRPRLHPEQQQCPPHVFVQPALYPHAETVTVRETRLVVRADHERPVRGARRTHPTQERRRQLRERRKAGHTRGAQIGSLETGKAVGVTVNRDRETRTILRVKVETFDTPAQAQAELARRQARKARRHPLKQDDRRETTGRPGQPARLFEMGRRRPGFGGPSVPRPGRSPASIFQDVDV